MSSALAATVLAAPAAAPAAESCQQQWDNLTDRVLGVLDRAGAAPVRTERFEDFCAYEPAVGVWRRRVIVNTHFYVELIFDNGTIVYRDLNQVVPDPLQDHADPGTIDATASDADAVTCPDGSAYYFHGSGTDMPADVGAASGSNPNIQDFGGDDYLTVSHLCELP